MDNDYTAKIHTLADIPRIYGQAWGDKCALIFQGRETSYRRLDNYSSQVANGLVQAGCGPQSRMVYLGKNTDWYFELLLGAGKANVVMAPLNWRLAPAELETIIRDAEPVLMFAEPEFYEPLQAAIAQLQLPVILLAEAPLPGTECYPHWRDRQSDSDPGIPVAPDDVVLQMYTSGTTGRPKGVQMTNNALFFLRHAEAKAGDWARWNPEDVSLVAMPVFHIGGTAWGFTGLYHGATNVIMPQAEPVELIRLVQQYKVKKLFAVPALLLFIVQYPQSTPERFRHVEVVLYGASPIPEDLLRRAMALFNADFVQLYGMTETTGSMTFLPPDEHRIGDTGNGTGRLKSCGRAMPGVEIRVVDPLGNALPPDQVGEILIKTPSIMKGYWRREDATRDALQNGWYYTGDAGYLDSDGFLYIHDRVKDMIVSGGENIYPAEVESVLFEHPQVADVAVIGVPSEQWGEAVKALVVREPGQFPSESLLISHCRTRLGGYKVPKSVDFVDELPRNPSGKLLKKELRKRYWEGRERMVN